MHRRLIAALLTIAFITLILCGWGFFTLSHQHDFHTSEHQLVQQFVDTLTVHASEILLVLTSIFLFVTITRFAVTLPQAQPWHVHSPPDIPTWHPLRLAFSDGILNPKIF